MKILHIIPWYYPAFKFGGPIISVHNLNKILVKKGVDVTVYTTSCGVENKVTPNTKTIIDDLKIFYFNNQKMFDFLNPSGYQMSIDLTKALKNHINNFDLIHITAIWNYTTLAGYYFSKKYRKPYILSPRGSLCPYTFNKKSWKKLPYYYLIAKKILSNATLIHYTTEDEKELSHNFLELKNKAVVVPNGLHLLEFENLPERKLLSKKYPQLNGKKVILFLSRLNWKKGLDLLIKAISMLSIERKDIHLLIVGDDDGDGYRRKVEGWVKTYNIESIVTFTGLLTGGDKLMAYSGSDIFVLPSYSENFGMAVVEAMSTGCPVVISNRVGIYREVEENKAGIIVDTNPESLYKGIKTLLDNESLQREISENAKKMVKEYYDIDKVANKMIELYKDAIDK